MDIFGKYLGEQVAKQAQTVNRVLEAQRLAAAAAARMRQGAQAAAPVVYTPPPRAAAPSFGGSVGQAVARAAVQAASAAPAVYSPAPPPPPTFGQRIAQQIVDQTQQATAQVRTPFMEQASIAPVAPISGFSQQTVEPVEPWQTWQSPEGDRVVMPGSYTPPETWQPMGGAITEPTQIENAQNSQLAYDNQPPEVQSQIAVPNAPAIRGIGDVARSVGGDVLGIARQAEQQANRNLDQNLDISGIGMAPGATATGAANRALTTRSALQSDSPYVRVRASRTGLEYVVPRERIGNIDTDDVILGPADTQPESDRDRNNVTPAEAYDTFNKIDQWFTDTYVDTLGSILPNIVGYIEEPGGLPRVMGDIWNIVDRSGADDVAEAVWTSPIPGTDTSIADIATDIWNIDIGGVTIGDAITTVFRVAVAPGEDVLSATSDRLYEQISGNPATDDGTTTGDLLGQIPVIGGGAEEVGDWLMGSSGTGMVGIAVARPYVDWARQNQEQFVDLYENGYDSDGDGTADLFGADATTTYWLNEDAGLAEAIFVQVVTDPFSVLPFVGVAAGRGRTILRGAAAASPSVGRARFLTEGADFLRGTQRVARALDEAGAMGLGVVLDRVAMPLGRKFGDVTRIARESRHSRQGSMPAEAGGTGVGLIPRMDGSFPDVDPRSVDGGTIETTAAPVARSIASEPPPPDPRTAGSETRPPAPRSKPTPNLNPGPDLRTPDGGTLATRVADGEGGTVTRRVNPEGGVEAIGREGVSYGPSTIDAPGGGSLDVSGVTQRRFLEPIRRSAMTNGPDVTQVAIDTMRASGRFIDQTALGRAIADAQGTNAATVDHVLATSDFTREWNDALVTAGGQPLPFTPSVGQGTTYAWGQQVIHQPWTATAAQRRQLYESGELLSRLPASPSPVQMAAAERYADMVDTHRFWNPTATTDPKFREAMAQAAEIRKRLDDLEYEGRPTGNIRRGNLLGAGDTPQARIAPATDPSLNAQATDSGFANAAQVRKVLLDGENEFGEIAGYPVIDQRQGGRNGDMVQEVRIDEDTTVTVRPVREANVPRELKAQHPEATSIWAKADLNDPSVAPGEVSRTAPTMTEAVEQVAAEAQARGLVNAEAPSPGTATDATPPPELDPAPNVTEANARVTTPNPVDDAKAKVRALWGDINPENVTPALKKAVDNGWIADGRTAVAFEKNVVKVKKWTDRDADMILEALNDMRVTNGSVEAFTITDVPDLLANPNSRKWLDDAERMARLNDAIDVQDSIIRSADSTADAKKAARVKTKELEAKRTTLRKEWGWTDPAKKQSPKRVPTASEKRATDALGRVIPADTKNAKYVTNLKKLKSLEFGDAPVNNLTMDADGMVRFHGAVLTDDEIAAMTRETFADGDTFLDRWNRYLTESRGDPQNPSTIRNEDAVSASLASTMTDYEALAKTLYPTRELPGVLRWINTYTTYLREKILGSWLSAPRYIFTQVIGNPLNMMIGGYGTLPALRDMLTGIRRSYKDTHHMTSLVGGDVFRNGNPVLHTDRIANTWGTTRAPEVRRHVSSGTDITKDYGVMEAAARRHGWSTPLARPAAAVFGDTRVIRAGGAVDMSARDAVYAAAFHRQVKETITDFRIQTTDLLMVNGLTRRQAVDAINKFRQKFPDGFTSNDVRDFFGDYLPNGKAERLARDWQSAVNATNIHARNEVKRVLFAGTETKLDAAIKPFFMFHYFMSRQYFYLIRQALHHPGLLNAYAMYNEMATEYYEKHKDEIPSWLQGYVKIAINGPLGLALFVNPVSLLSVGNIWQGADIDFGDPMGSVEKVVEEIGKVAFLSPLITDTLNVLGYLGDGRSVDFFRLQREFEAYNVVENFLIGLGLNAEYNFSNPVLDFGNRIRSQLSGLGLPGSEEIEFISTQEAEMRQVRSFVEDEARREGIIAETPEGAAQIDAIMSDPSHPIYQRGLGRYLWGEAIQLASRALPFRPQVRGTNELGQDLLTNTTAAQRTLINSTEDARALRTQETGYYAIGDTQVANVADMIYNDVAYADNVFFNLTVDGVTYEHYEIEKMSEEERQDLAKAWLSENNLYYIWQRTKDGQDQFLAQPENAEYATFKRWQGEIADYPGGLEAYWEQAATENESARAYLDGLDPDLSEFQREKALRSKWGYLAIRGVPVGFSTNRDGETYAVSDYRSPEGRPTNGYDPVNIANQPPTPTEYEPYESDFNVKLREDLDSYQRYRAQDEVVLQQIFSDWGMSPDTSLGALDYRTSQAVKKEFTARTGEYITKPSPAVEDFFKFKDENPNATLEQYIAYNDRQYIRGLPSSFTEEQNRPEEGAPREDDAYRYFDKDEYRGD